MLPQVKHVYPPTTIPTPCHIVRLADFLADEEIAWVHDGYIIEGVEGNYSEFVWDHLQAAWLAGRYFSSFLRSNFYSANSFSFFFLVTILGCWIFSLYLLKERKGGRKRKRFPFLTILVVLLVPSWRFILIFWHGSMM